MLGGVGGRQVVSGGVGGVGGVRCIRVRRALGGVSWRQVSGGWRQGYAQRFDPQTIALEPFQALTITRGTSSSPGLTAKSSSLAMKAWPRVVSGPG